MVLWREPKRLTNGQSATNLGGNKMIHTSETYKERLHKLLPKSDFELIDFQGTKNPCTIHCNICDSNFSFNNAGNVARRARRECRNVCQKCEENVWQKKQKDAYHKAQTILNRKKTIVLNSELHSWGQKEKVEWKCLKCGHTFERSPHTMFIQSGLSCKCPWCETHPYCYDEKTIVGKVKERWGDEYVVLQSSKIKKDTRGRRRVLVKHNKCGFVYAVDLWKLLNETGCPKCRASRGEKKVRQYLKSRNFTFQEQKSIEANSFGLLFLDFYLEENGQKFAIEYNGKQHYEPVEFFGGEDGYLKQKIRDQKKIEYCKKNDIILIIIPYNDESLLLSEELAQRLRGQAP